MSKRIATTEQKVAAAVRAHERYLRYKDEYIAKAKEWWRNNKDKRKIIQTRSNAKRADAVRLTRSAWWEKNPNKRAEYALNVDKEAERLRWSEYARNNPKSVNISKKKYKDANREKINADNSRYAKSHPEMVVIRAQNRRARIRKAGGTLSKDITKRLMTLQKGKCACCASKLPKQGYHLDHIMPLVLGGAHADANIQLTCASCNLQKNAKHPVDFMQSRGFLL